MPKAHQTTTISPLGMDCATSARADAAGQPPGAVGQNWSVYVIRRQIDGRAYVGLTKRPLPVRIAMHDLLARRRPHLGGPGSLAEAIRQARAQGRSITEAFQVEVLAETSSAEEARRLERGWIARLATARPGGFNLIRGGSLGGPANAEPVRVDHPSRGALHYPSLMDAVADTNRERRRNAEPPLPLGVVYARRVLQWPVEQALELQPHADGRRQRAPFRWHGKVYQSLRQLSIAEGLPIPTTRSRLHRARRAGCGPEHDAAHDRRRPGARRSGDVACGRLPPLALPHPRDPDAPPVGAASFARLTGIPRASVLNRYHRLVSAAGDATTLTRAEILAALTQGRERRVLISLLLPDGRALTGGVREVIRQVLDDPALRWGRDERWLGSSAIRARLRRIPGWPDCLPPAAVRWAFGFQPDAGPTGSPAAAPE